MSNDNIDVAAVEPTPEVETVKNKKKVVQPSADVIVEVATGEPFFIEVESAVATIEEDISNGTDDPKVITDKEPIDETIPLLG